MEWARRTLRSWLVEKPGRYLGSRERKRKIQSLERVRAVANLARLGLRELGSSRSFRIWFWDDSLQEKILNLVASGDPDVFVENDYFQDRLYSFINYSGNVY